MLPRLGASKLVSQWITLTLVASIIAAVDGGWLAGWTSLAPARVWRGEVWRIVTWPFIESGPISLVVTCLAIYKFGGELAVRWGDRRLRRFALEIVVAASVVTCLLASVVGAGYLERAGGWAITEALLIAWARQFPRSPLLLYGLVAVQGERLVAITLGTAILLAIFAGPVYAAPELVACGLATLYPRGWLAR